MSKTLAFAYPGELQTPTGGYAYDRRVISSLSDLGWEVRPVSLGSGFPHPEPHQLLEAEEKLQSLPGGTLVVVDGLAFGVLERWAARDAHRLSIVALVHHPLAMETGLTPEERDALLVSERAALRHAAGIVVTSSATALLLVQSYDVPRSKLLVAVPGVDPAPSATGTREPPLILSVGSLTRRKGHDILLAALELIADLSWTCRIVGSRGLDPRTADELEDRLSRSSVRERVMLLGAVDDARDEFAKADIFSLASRYEGYGMVFAEAMTHGLPIVGCKVGAVPDVVPEGAGILVPPDDAGAFASALRCLLQDDTRRMAMSNASSVAGAHLPSWTETATLISRFLRQRHGL